jgi:hypothetical protein
LAREHEAVHLAAVDAERLPLLAVRVAVVAIEMVQVRRIAHGRVPRIGQARHRPRETIGAGKRSKIVVERSILLHDEDDVLQRTRRSERLGSRGRLQGGREQLERRDRTPNADRHQAEQAKQR